MPLRRAPPRPPRGRGRKREGRASGTPGTGAAALFCLLFARVNVTVVGVVVVVVVATAATVATVATVADAAEAVGKLRGRNALTTEDAKQRGLAGTLNDLVRPECRVFKRASRIECEDAAQTWMRDASECFLEDVGADVLAFVRSRNAFTTWIPRACPSPCTRRALEIHQDPADYCASLPGEPQTDVGGEGCYGFTSCRSIRCAENCAQAPMCQWIGKSAGSGRCVSAFDACSSDAACAECYGLRSPCCASTTTCARCGVAAVKARTICLPPSVKVSWD